MGGLLMPCSKMTSGTERGTTPKIKREQRNKSASPGNRIQGPTNVLLQTQLHQILPSISVTLGSVLRRQELFLRPQLPAPVRTAVVFARCSLPERPFPSFPTQRNSVHPQKLSSLTTAWLPQVKAVAPPSSITPLFSVLTLRLHHLCRSSCR